MKLHLLVVMVLMCSPAQSKDLWCMPNELCNNGVCKPTTDTEMSVRLHDPDGATPELRSHAESISMTKIHDTETQQWTGKNASGGTEILAVLLADMTFAYVETSADLGQINKASGLCEVQ